MSAAIAPPEDPVAQPASRLVRVLLERQVDLNPDYVQRQLQRNADRLPDEIYDVTPIEWIAWTPFLIAIVVFGVYPQLMFKVMDPAVTEMVRRLGETLG